MGGTSRGASRGTSGARSRSRSRASAVASVQSSQTSPTRRLIDFVELDDDVELAKLLREFGAFSEMQCSTPEHTFRDSEDLAVVAHPVVVELPTVKVRRIPPQTRQGRRAWSGSLCPLPGEYQRQRS